MGESVPDFTRHELRMHLAKLPRRTRWQILRRGATHDLAMWFAFVGIMGLFLVPLGFAVLIEPVIGTGRTALLTIPLAIFCVWGLVVLIRAGSEHAIVRSLNRLEPDERQVARDSFAAGKYTRS